MEVHHESDQQVDAGRRHAHPGTPSSNRSWRSFLRKMVSLGRHHHHQHGHQPDLTRASSDARAEGVCALFVSLVGLGATAALQMVVVLMSGSVALLADTVHNLSDALTAVPLGVAFWLGRRRPNARYNYGYGRAEDLAGVLIVFAIGASAVFAAWETVQRIVSPQPIANVGWVLAAGVIGFAGNELVAVYRIKVGRRIGSAALEADGLHARADGITSLAVIGGALGAAAGWELADPLVGLLIAVGILLILVRAARDIVRRVMDGVDPGLIEEVKRVASEVDGVEAVEAVRLRWVGHDLISEVEVVSDCDLSLGQAHDIAEYAHHRLLHEIPRLARATIHTSPCDHDGRRHHETTAHHFLPADERTGTLTSSRPS